MSTSVASPLLREDDQGIPCSLPLLAALVEAEARCCAAARPADSGPVHAFRAGAVPKVPVRIFLEQIYLLTRSMPATRGMVRIDGAAGSACCAGLGRVGSRSCGVRRIGAHEAAQLRRRYLCLKPCPKMYMEFLEKNRIRLHQFGIKGRKVLAWGCGTDASATQLSTSPAIAMHPTEPLTWKQEPRTKGIRAMSSKLAHNGRSRACWKSEPVWLFAHWLH